jgi:hypothetical protein
MIRELFMLKKLLPAVFLLVGFQASAGVITGGTYLDAGGASQMQHWLGTGDLDFTNIWSGSADPATASADWHAAVDGAGPTVSIYEARIHDGTTAYIGGYTANSWGFTGSANDPTAFIFNLTTLEMQLQESLTSSNSIYTDASRLASFGGGHDLTDTRGGYSYSYTYDISQGQITIADDSGSGSGSSGIHYTDFTMTGLQTYTFNTADAAAPSAVHEPSVIALFTAGLFGLGFARRRRFKPL